MTDLTRQLGFSLIELILAMAITGIVSGTLFLKYNTMQADTDVMKRLVERQTIRLDSILRQIQLAAVMHQKIYGIRFRYEFLGMGEIRKGQWKQSDHTILTVVDNKGNPVTLPGLTSNNMAELRDSYANGHVLIITSSSSVNLWPTNKKQIINKDAYLFFNERGMPIGIDGVALDRDFNMIIESVSVTGKTYKVNMTVRKKTGFIVKGIIMYYL